MIDAEKIAGLLDQAAGVRSDGEAKLMADAAHELRRLTAQPPEADVAELIKQMTIAGRALYLEVPKAVADDIAKIFAKAADAIARLSSSPPADVLAAVREDQQKIVADALKTAWAEHGDVPFPLYDREADAMAGKIVAALVRSRPRPAPAGADGWMPISTAPSEREIALETALRELVDGIDKGAIRIDGPIVQGETPDEQWPWADEWLHNSAKRALAKPEGE